MLGTQEKDYLYYENRCNSRYERRCIDGHITSCGKCIGYCQYSGHSGYLTEQLAEKHECLEKGCFYFLPKIKKEDPKNKNSKNVEKIKSLITSVVSGYEGMKVTKIYKKTNGEWLVKYITITSAYSIKSIEEKLSDILEMPIKMYKVECDFELAAKAIFS